jgi:hypothetical protein
MVTALLHALLAIEASGTHHAGTNAIAGERKCKLDFCTLAMGDGHGLLLGLLSLGFLQRFFLFVLALHGLMGP